MELDDDGAIVMPKTTEYVFIEVGCSDRDTLDEQLLDAHPNAFLISFEPMLDKWAVLTARGLARYHGRGSRDKAVPLGHHHQRGVVLPFAVSPTSGPMQLHVSGIAGCTSLQAQQARSKQWVPFCNRPLENRLVQAVTLRDVLELAGARPVRVLKVDAQGVDFQLVDATPKV